MSNSGAKRLKQYLNQLYVGILNYRKLKLVVGCSAAEGEGDRYFD
jgi:hypothetical protein